MTGALAQPLAVPGVDDLAGRAARRFTAEFGSPPEGVWWAPGRVNLIGEHVDYHDGLVLPVALQVGTAVAAARLPGRRVRAGSAQTADVLDVDLADIGPGQVPGWAGYAAGVPWALAEDGLDVGGVALWVDGTVPEGAGLSSSAALECAVAVAMADLFDLPGAAVADDRGRRLLVQACIRAENDIAGASTGGMDQSVSLRAREGTALLLDCRDWSVAHLALDVPLAADGLGLLVIDTRAHHTHAGGEYGDRRALSMAAARRLGVRTLRDLAPRDLPDALAALPDAGEQASVRHVVTEIVRVRQAAAALREGRARDIGPLLLASHASLRDDYRVSSPELDAVVAAAIDAGASGARMTGGGFGGSAVVLCRTVDIDDVITAVAAVFAANGWAAPATLVVTNGGGPAHRVR